MVNPVILILNIVFVLIYQKVFVLIFQKAAEKVKQTTKLSEKKPKSSAEWLVSLVSF